MVGASGIPPCAHTCSSALVAADNDVCVSMSMLNTALQGTGGLPMAGNLQFCVNPENPLLVGQPQMHGVALVFITAVMIQPQLHGMTQSDASQYPPMTPQSVVSHTTQQGNSAPYSNGHTHLSPSPPPSLQSPLKAQHCN